ncbi:ribonucleoside-diphosphate reductase subunit alpha [Hymenobacter sp. M29]|uniref:Ribonucleoside-diphosphate reductase n=1 Tax=Hymenobacter mellowenesis TaxID=3063995 RepID=A0ABT9AE50_9BACT|nr:ribonucleoside-diphosphate reductase subunit alpha [Hymenobacter sp. M29]MDO7847654.1 ribonucleoside-diphosphate reductase subunit alpha [Hymenobacter sp. M29]
MEVVKRNGKREAFNPSKIQKRVKEQTKGLKVNADEVCLKVIGGFSDGITSHELDNYAAETAATMSMNHPDYSTLAARLLVTSLHKETYNSFIDAVLYLNDNTQLLSMESVKTCVDYCMELDQMVDHSRDFNLDYFGLKTLLRGYLLKANGKVVERPQYLYMRVAVALWGDNLEMVKRVYDDLSLGKYIHATPTLFNAGCRNAQMSSCFLIGNKGDSKEGLMDTFKDVGIISSAAGGIGLHVHDVRAEGTLIAGSGGKSNGLMPLLKSYNEWSKWWDQGGGKRKGSFAIYLEPWHKDVFTLLPIRKNQGKEEFRARELFPALWIPDLFMQRVESHGKWTLFCPHEVFLATGKKLQDVFDSPTSKAFTELYTHCESLGIGKEIEAQDLWNEIEVCTMETGTPFMLFKDACNSKSNQQNLGTIKSSNLCTEIIEYSDHEEQAVCNLASLALPKYLKPREYVTIPEMSMRGGDGPLPNQWEVDHQALYEDTYQVTLNLNRVIDINYYPTPETRKSNLRHRPIGIGVQGLADLFALMGLPFDSPEAAQVNKEVFETIYYGFLQASVTLSLKQGHYETFPGSPASKGILQFDMWGITPSSRWNWEALKEDVVKYGLRNSLGIAPMPTASTSQIMGWNECFEPFNSNLSTRRTLAGEFIVINKHLVRDLEALGLWNKGMKDALVVGNGSVQGIPSIPQVLKDRYKTVYEISQKVILNMAADRGAYICQSQSMNLFIDKPTLGKLSSMHFYGWKLGLKTGQYYLRTKPASQAIQFTVDKSIPIPEEVGQVCEIGCESCGS